MPSGAKNWCFTFNNPTSTDLPVDWKQLLYRIYQTEQGVNGTIHLQGFCSFHKRLTLKHVRELLPLAHWEVARGSPLTNYQYCTKPDTRVGTPVEFGQIQGIQSQGHRTDIADAIQKILSDRYYKGSQLMEDYPGLFVRYPRLIGQVRSTREPHSRTAGITCQLLFGAPGTGKSRYVYAKHPQAFRKPSGNWFDGYEGQDDILLEDFDSTTLDHQHLLTLLDRYPLSAPVKGSFVSIHASSFFITSNNEPQDWYPDEYQRKRFLLRAIHRRITTVSEFFLDADGRTFIHHWAGPRFFGPDRYQSQPDRIELDPFSPSLIVNANTPQSGNSEPSTILGSPISSISSPISINSSSEFTIISASQGLCD